VLPAVTPWSPWSAAGLSACHDMTSFADARPFIKPAADRCHQLSRRFARTGFLSALTASTNGHRRSPCCIATAFLLPTRRGSTSVWVSQPILGLPVRGQNRQRPAVVGGIKPSGNLRPCLARRLQDIDRSWTRGPTPCQVIATENTGSPSGNRSTAMPPGAATVGVLNSSARQRLQDRRESIALDFCARAARQHRKMASAGREPTLLQLTDVDRRCALTIEKAMI
jgi:hypothetical protein